MPCWAGRFPTLDFAGGTVVHVTSGVRRSCRAVSGATPRISETAMPPHSVVLSFMGACCCGSDGSASTPVARFRLASCNRAFVATHFGAAAATLDERLRGWRSGKPSALGDLGACRLVAITPAAGFVSPCRRLRSDYLRRLLLPDGGQVQDARGLRRFARRLRYPRAVVRSGAPDGIFAPAR